MVKSRGFPLRAIVAIGARRDISLRKLTTVRVRMALLAFQRSLREVRVDQLCPQIGRLVAIHAGHGAMGAHQGKLRFRMIKAGQVLPVPGGVATLAAGAGSVGPKRFHALGELVVVRILMTGSARNILEMIDGGCPITRGFGRRRSLRGHRSRQQRRTRKR